MRSTALAGLAGLLFLAACGDGGPNATGQVAVGVATDASAAGSAPTGALLADTYTDLDGNTLVIDSVSVVVRKLRLEGGDSCPGMDDDEMPDSLMTAGDSSEMEHEGMEDCGVLKLGPFLVDLPLNGGVDHQFTVAVDTGTYEEVSFQIHKPAGGRDAAFLAEHPAYDGVSLRVVGTFNAAPFVYTSDVTSEQELDLVPPLVVTEGTTSFTLRVDLAGWFRGASGGLIDPATAVGDGANAGVVRLNILRSFHGFEDEDHDGHDDHDAMD